MDSKEIRRSFIKYFNGKGHNFVRSSPVVPIDDPTLLFTNAGMNQFKPIFLNQIESHNKRAVNSQKCIRVSGKHNDLEEVGVDTFHHTFFEMLGNWSFGDYYKREAIEWAWDLFTGEWKLDKNRLWATVYEKDDEAFELWKQVTDIDPDRVIRCGKRDNFWEMGETGPCGPCSEIHYFVGDNINEQDSKGVNASDQYWELWNLVFIQNNRLEDGTLEDLPFKHVDTGAGLERIAAVLQGKTSNYDTDLFQPIIASLQKLSDSAYENNPVPHRVIADHIRMLCFSIADGALPSNDGRGYVLRRILRRAARFGRKLGLEDPFLYKLVPVVSEIMGDIFPEVKDKQPHIEKVLLSEEKSFNQTLDRGLNHFEKLISNLSGSEISGEDAFKLYDTYGFPLDLTQLMSKEKGISVDEKGFNFSMDEQKRKAKESGKFKQGDEQIDWTIVSEGKDSTFLGYELLECTANIQRYAKNNDQWLVVLDQTPFYAESGGQIGDIGTIKGEGFELSVVDVKKDNDSFIHLCDSDMNSIKEHVVQCSVNKEQRNSIKKNHTATHLMHKALKKVLGDHVNQAGSLVHPDYLRFDLTHFEKISSKQIVEIENMVNEQILMNTALNVSIQNFEEAKDAGAEALFGEKYGENVRVVEVGDYSIELCGGTHVDRTGDIGLFKITEESSLASGVRRIVGVTGKKAISLMQEYASILDNLQLLLNAPPNEMVVRVKNLFHDKKNLENKLKDQPIKVSYEQLMIGSKEIKGSLTIIKEVEVSSIDQLKLLGDDIFNKLSNGIAVLFSKGEEKPMAIIVVSKNLNKNNILAGDLAKIIGGYMEGGGGGKPHMATAGGKNNGLINNAIDSTTILLNELLNG